MPLSINTSALRIIDSQGKLKMTCIKRTDGNWLEDQIRDLCNGLYSPVYANPNFPSDVIVFGEISSKDVYWILPEVRNCIVVTVVEGRHSSLLPFDPECL